MLTGQVTKGIATELSRCRDQSGVSNEGQDRHYKADEADASIAEKVDRALWKDGMLRNTDYHEIDIHVREGIVYLSGHVMSTANRQRAERAVGSVQGIVGMKNNLISDDILARDLAAALGQIEHTYGNKFFTGVRNGVVVLNGDVGSATVRSLAEKSAAGIPGVRGVVNNVQHPGIGLDADDRRFLQPSIGLEIYFRDGPSGTVRRVIINPNNRRVVAMIVQGQFSKPQLELQYKDYGETQTPEPFVVIPVRMIRHLTENSAFLLIDSTDTARYEYFDPACFIAPNEAWVPPYPYCPADVLFPI